MSKRDGTIQHTRQRKRSSSCVGKIELDFPCDFDKIHEIFLSSDLKAERIVVKKDSRRADSIGSFYGTWYRSIAEPFSKTRGKILLIRAPG